MRQEIYEDPFDFADWRVDVSSRCFVHLCNALDWREITGDDPPKTPATHRKYQRVGLPWFDWYSEAPALKGAKRLKRLRSVAERKRRRSDRTRSNRQTRQVRESSLPKNVITLNQPKNPNQVREFE